MRYPDEDDAYRRVHDEPADEQERHIDADRAHGRAQGDADRYERAEYRRAALGREIETPEKRERQQEQAHDRQRAFS